MAKEIRFLDNEDCICKIVKTQAARPFDKKVLETLKC